jgi:hypothetical protein
MPVAVAVVLISAERQDRVARVAVAQDQILHRLQQQARLTRAVVVERERNIRQRLQVLLAQAAPALSS